MAYFAKLGIGDVVESVTVVHDDIAISEQAGIDFLNTLFKTNNVWKQTYIDGSKRKRYASKGYSYNPSLDSFITPAPDYTWVLNESTCEWEEPPEAVSEE